MLNGLLIFNKPEGFTSHDVVAKLRGIFGQRRIGHGGTLDPMATGVLPVFLGNATRASQYVTAAEKRYIATFKLGFSTDTQDRTGKIVRSAPVCAHEGEIEKALPAFLGEILQIPPMYSAISVDGKRLYDLARKDMTVERAPRRVEIKKIKLLDRTGEHEYRLDVCCSKGTYVRTLISDLGDALGCGATLTGLVRLQTGNLFLDDAVGFDAVERAKTENRLKELLTPVDELFDYPKVVLDEEPAERAKHGAWLSAQGSDGATLPDSELFRVYDQMGRFVMLAKKGLSPAGQPALVVEKMFWNGDMEL